MLNNNNNVGGLLNALFGGQRSANASTPPVVLANGSVAYPGSAGYVTDKDMRYIRENTDLQNENTQLKSKIYTNEYVTQQIAPIFTELSNQKQEICDLKAALAMEAERRACGDENLLTYVKGNYVKAEKAINSRDINYHGVRARLVIDEDCCERDCA